MNLRILFEKIVILSLLLFFGFLSIVFVFNSLINFRKNFTSNLLKNLGVVEYSSAAMSPLFEFYLKDLKVSNESLNLSLYQMKFHLSPVNFIVGKNVLDNVFISNISLVILSGNSSGTNHVELKRYLSEYVSNFGNVKVFIADGSVLLGGSRLHFNKFLIQNQDGDISVDIITYLQLLPLSFGEMSNFASFKVDTSLILKPHENFGVKGIIKVKDINIYSYSVDEISLLIFGDLDLVQVFGFNEKYSTEIKISNFSQVEGKFSIEDLIGDKITIQTREYISNLGYVSDLIRSVLSRSDIEFFWGNGNYYLSVNSSSLNLLLSGDKAGAKILLNSTTSNGTLSFYFQDSMGFGSFRNIQMMGNRIDGRFVVSLSGELNSVNVYNLMVNRKSFIYPLRLEFKDLGNIVFRSKVLEGHFSLSEKPFVDFDAKTEFLYLLSDALKLGIPNVGNGSIRVNLDPLGYFYGVLDTDLVSSEIYVRNGLVRLKKMNFRFLGIDSSGNLTIDTNQNLVGVLEVKTPIEKFFTEVRISTNRVYIFSKDKLLLDGIILGKSFKLNFLVNNFNFGNFYIEKVSGFVTELTNNFSINLKAYGLSSKFDLFYNKSANKVNIYRGFAYTFDKSFSFSGFIDIASLYSEINISPGSKLRLSLNGDQLDVDLFLTKFSLRPLSDPIYEFSLYGKLTLDISKTNWVDFIRYADIYGDAKLFGFFYKASFKVTKFDDKILSKLTLHNFENIFYVNYEDRDTTKKLDILATPVSGKKFPRAYGGVSLTNSEGGWSGKLKVNISEFSGLNENWERNIFLSSQGIISISGFGDGVNAYISPKDSIHFSYFRNSVELYRIQGNYDREAYKLKVLGRIPLNFLLIPGLISRFDGYLEPDNFTVIVYDSPFRIAFSGKVNLVAKALNFEIFRNTFKYVKGSIAGNQSVLSSSDITLSDGENEIRLVAKVDFTHRIDNPYIDLLVEVLKGNLFFNIDTGDFSAFARAVGKVRIYGRADSPIITGNIRSFENSQFTFNTMRQISPNNLSNDLPPSFIQLMKWDRFVIHIEKGLNFYSEFIRGYSSDPSEIILNGSIFDKTLALYGTVTLGRGELRYFGKFFEIESIKLEFKGKSFDFVPRVYGKLYAYVYDNVNLERVKIFMDVDGDATKLNPVFYSDPYRTQTEISLLLGINTDTSGLTKESIELVESLGVYDIISYNIRKFSGLDIFNVRSSFVSYYIFSFMDNRRITSLQDMLSGTTLSIGKYILPSLLVEYTLSFETFGDNTSQSSVLLHNFGIGWSIYNLDLGFSYSSYISENKQIMFEPKFNVKYIKRF